MGFPLQLQQYDLGSRKFSLFVPDPESVQRAYQNGEISFPYWSRVWPAAKALALFLSDHPFYTENKNIVELGAGLGLPSIVSAQNAASVLCSDHVAEAVAVAEKSAAYYGFDHFKTAVLDWNDLPEGLEADVWLLSDVNYEPLAFKTLLQVIENILERGSLVILSTPQRLVAKDFINPLVRFCKSSREIIIQQDGVEVSTTVMVLTKK